MRFLHSECSLYLCATNLPAVFYYYPQQIQPRFLNYLQSPRSGNYVLIYLRMNTVPSFSARPRQRACSDFGIAEALKAHLSLRYSCSDGLPARLGIEHSSILHYWLRACPTAPMAPAKHGRWCSGAFRH